MTLTPKQERFALAFVETGNASEAYRRAYDAHAMRPATIHNEASRLLGSPKVARRVADLRGEAHVRHGVTLQGLVAELDEARELALSGKQASAATAAILGKAKLLGFLADAGGKVEVHARAPAIYIGGPPEPDGADV